MSAIIWASFMHSGNQSRKTATLGELF